MKYRPEIDGLRALAVVPVILFHAGFDFFSGGFVGVDVFFVISGYLITKIIIEDLENNRFSLVSFYERRALRILPALFFVILVCIPFAWMWMLPSQMKEFSQSIVAVGLFASNIFFLRESGYFDTAVEEKPLLHTWSLAVEEQYYVFFPVFLILVWRSGKNRVFWMIVFFAAISLLISEWGWRHRATANFYLAPTRAWELLAGSIAAFIVQKQGAKKNNACAFIGFFAIILSIFLYDESTPFPSVYALVPVVGVVLIILYAEQETIVAKVLSNKIFVGIGLISYSAYLWHQPIFAFAKISSSNTLPGYTYFFLSIIIFPLAYLSWKYIESPFRRNRLSRTLVFSLSGAVLISAISAGLYGHLKNGFPYRYSNSELALLVGPIKGDSSGCHNELGADGIRKGMKCVVTSDKKNKINTVVIGDSHAATITDALKYSLGKHNLGFYSFTGSWCAPLMHFATNTEQKKGCNEITNAAFQQIISSDKIHNVVLFAEWANYDWGYRWNDKYQAIYQFRVDDKFDFSNAKIHENIKQFSRATEYTFRKLHEANKKVVVVLSTPEFEVDVPTAINPRAPFVKENVLKLDIQDYAERSSRVTEILKKYATDFGFSLVNPSEILCNDYVCFSHGPDGVYYTDGNHLSLIGASLITPSIKSGLLR